MMRQTTNNNAHIQQLVDSEVEDEIGATEADTEAEQKAFQYWKTFSIKQVINLVVQCWDNIIPATVSHAWCNIFDGFPEDITGDCQSIENELEAAAKEARGIAARGFEGITGDEIRKMFQRAPVSAEDMSKLKITKENRIYLEKRQFKRD